MKNTLKLTCMLIFTISSIPLFSQIPENGLVGYYTLDGNTADSSSYAHNGTIVGDVIPTEDRFENSNKAYLFKGGYINLGNPIHYYLLTHGISISAWVKPKSVNDEWQAIVSKWYDSGVGAFYLGINPTSSSIRWNIDSPVHLEGNELIPDEWKHVTATYDLNSVNLYENGILISTQFYQIELSNINENLLIGGQASNPSLGFNGSIDDVLIYNRALSPQEIQSIYSDEPIIPTNTNDLSLEQKEISISPNPSNGHISVDSKGIEITRFTVFNSIGERVLGEIYGSKNIDLSFLSPGIYFLNLESKNTTITKRISIN